MKSARIAWLTTGVAALAGLWTMGSALPPDWKNADLSLHLIELLWLGSPYLGFACLAYAWRRYRVASWTLLAITTVIAVLATWVYSELLRPGNAASLGTAYLPLYQWKVIAAILVAWLLVRMSHLVRS